ncbi:MAG TPA: flagellar export chaperone FliS [Treponemataceae bacterium]|nr:MAG: Flagellar protein FliS [Spirochaetes bacterium ADurb.Bin269]TAH54128.1 MAG: flagellar export chaperone FliS [Treponema sp.]HOC30555.1 flagellar export chaperone FliS [Treponemataceae bacterium]HPX48482.1 flagellar export chaperone FliS [Treponemataceae bacterium]HQL33126.1 flagellar export chaperone FliS [Treponemataceae bacterium]
MSYNQALSAYRETRVKTASQGTLIIMLYDEAIKQMGAAISLFTEEAQTTPSKIEQIHNHILKSQEIITELMASLDMSVEGDISKNLFSLYSYFNQQLLEANVEKKPEKVSFVRSMMDQLRTAWVEIVNSTAVPAPLQTAPAGINIAG